MNSQQLDTHFDALTRSAARVSRRSVLRAFGLGAAGTVFGALQAQTAAAAGRLSSMLGRAPQQTGILPPPAEPWSSENPPDLDQIIDDYLDCIASGHSAEECDRGFPGWDWCQIVWDVITEAMPNLAGFASTFLPFSRNCGERDCFQCCYVPERGCHSSYIGFPVINCTPKIYGAGTRPVGLTFILDPDIAPEDSCLFIQQVCTHIGLCVNPVLASAASGPAAQGIDGAVPLAAETDYLADPRAAEQRARYFAQQVQTEVRAYLDTYATDTSDARPLQSLVEALTNRGRAGWRRDQINTPIDISHPAIRVNDAAGNLNESASWANAAQLLALARVLTGVPNLEGRLGSVESRIWTETDKANYLAVVGDPDQALAAHLDPHWVAILQRVGMLQDYALLSVPVAGEVNTAGQYGGETVGVAPVLSLSATTNGAGVNLSVRIVDQEDTAGGPDRPLAVDWGDGVVTHHALPAGQSTLAVAHTYAAAGVYAVYAVAASDSGLRGHAALVVEAEAAVRAQTTQATLPRVARVGLPGLSLTHLQYTKQFALNARLADATGASFRAGRGKRITGPTDIRVTVALGDLYLHNPARLDASVVSLEPRIEMAAPTSATYVSYLTMATMNLGVIDTASQQLREQPVTLTPDMLKLYLAGATTPLPSSVVTLDANGALHVPLFWRETTSAAWQKVARIDIELTTAMFDGFSLNSAAIAAPPGTHEAWVETRPGALASTTRRLLMPRVSR